MAQSERPASEVSTALALALDGIELVIFDFDGVIADSEVLSLGTLQDTLADCGLRMPLDKVRALFLGTSLKTITDYVARYGPEGAKDGFAERWQNALYERLRTELTPIMGVVPFLECLSEHGVRSCIASSSRFERIRLSLAAMNLEDQFPRLFSAEQVPNGKPAPDLFLFAAKHMNTDPGACLVVEDSPHGIQGAKAAGMRVFGFVDGAHLSDIQSAHRELLLNAGAERVLRNYAELLPAPPDGAARDPHHNQLGD